MHGSQPQTASTPARDGARAWGRIAWSLLALTACTPAPPSAPTEDVAQALRPHPDSLVLISIDTLRADQLGCYGKSVEGTSPSPVLDELARHGVLVRHCQSAATTTLCAHTSLFTGTYPIRHGVPRNGFRVSEDNELLAEVLRAHGFVTAAFVGGLPLGKGSGIEQGFEHYDDDFASSSAPLAGLERRAEDVTRATLSWVDRTFEKKPERPLFLFVHYFDVHAPYAAPAPDFGQYDRRTADEREALPLDSNAARALVQEELRLPEMRFDSEDAVFEPGFRARLESERPRGCVDARALCGEYLAELRYVDREVGRLLDGLRARGISDRALVVVTSDHGETFTEHPALFSHGSGVFESEVHVPLILTFPSRTHASRRLDGWVSSVDVYPTILDALQVPIPPQVEGKSFLPALWSEIPARGPVFCEATRPFDDPAFEDDPLWRNRPKDRGVRDGRFKLIVRAADGRRRLFDLDADPDEQHDLLRETPAAAEQTAAALAGALRAFDESHPPRTSTAVEDPELSRRLRELGYFAGAR